MEWYKDELRVSDGREELDLDLIHESLRSMPWAEGISRETVAR